MAPPAHVPAKIESMAGDGQSAPAGTAVATAPAVKVLGRVGEPIAGVLVTFQVTGGGGTVAPATAVATDASGVATVNSWRLGSSPGPNQLAASVSGSGVSGNPAVFTATGLVGSANKLVFIVQPSSTRVNAPITPAVKVQIQDARGNPVTSATNPVVITLSNNPTGATLSGTTTVNAAGGLATFGNLTVNTAGTGYTLTATSASGLIRASSAGFSVTNLAPAKLEKVAGEGQTAAAGATVATPPAVKVTDVEGNPVKDVLVVFKVTAGGGTVVPTTPIATDANGVAAVTSWTLGTQPGRNLLTATISGSGVTGNPAVFTATAQVGSANRLVFVTQPSNVAVGAAISPGVRVQVQDAVGNLVNSNAQVVITLGNNPSGAALSGTTTVNASGGTATFGNLRVNKAGTGYTLTATSPSGLIGASSAAFNVTNSAPAATADAYSTNEDTPLNVAAPGLLGNDSDPNGDPLTAVKITDPAHGAVTLNANGSFTYTPRPDLNGSDSFTYAASDASQNSSPATVAITVRPVNDAPSFTPGPDQSATAELQTVTVLGWATNISAGPLDEVGQGLSFTVTNNNNGAFTQQPAINAAGTLTFQTSLEIATVDVTVTLRDNGGTANNGHDTSSEHHFTIAIGP